MCKKLIVMCLLVSAIVISFLIPATSFGITRTFRPSNLSGSSGSVQIGNGFIKTDGDILVGFTDRAWPTTDLTFRGYVRFEVSQLPANACVSDVRLEVTCYLAGGPLHSLEVRELPFGSTSSNAFNLANDIINGLKYNYSSEAMRTTGAHTVVLSSRARRDLENARRNGYSTFNLGFTDMGEDAPTGIWNGWVHREPLLQVTYTVPVQIAPSVSSDNYTPCEWSLFTLRWNSVPNATTYDVKKGNGSWENHGPGFSALQSESVAGTYTYYVRGINDCATGPASQVVTVQVSPLPAVPSRVWTVDPSQCINTPYTVYWTAVTDAVSYEIKEDSDLTYVNVGKNLKKSYNHSSVGDHTYFVRGVNASCGAGRDGFSSRVKVLGTPSAASLPTTTNPTPCTDGSTTIRWRAVTDALRYVLTDSAQNLDVYSGPDTSWTLLHASGVHEYWLTVSNGCSWSKPNGPLNIATKQQVTPPGVPVSDRDSAVTLDYYTISWHAVPRATSYELFELGEGGITQLVYQGGELQKALIKSQPGIFIYTVEACGECGCSEVSGGLSVVVSPNCCAGVTGNIDCDPSEITDITDLTVLIDHLFISLAPLCCNKSANIDGDQSEIIDITDLTVLIDHLFISLAPTAVCR